MAGIISKIKMAINVTGLLTATILPISLAITYIFFPDFLKYWIAACLGVVTSIAVGMFFVSRHKRNIERSAEQEKREIQDQIDGAGI